MTLDERSNSIDINLDLARVDSARALLARHFAPTPIVRATSFSSPGRDVYLKDETVLPTGSFKVRGALYALSARLDQAPGQPVPEVVAASTGNHGAAVAWAGRLLRVPARIFLPEGANPVKVTRIRELGAALVEAGGDLSAAIDAALDYVARTGAFFLHDAADPNVPVGTGTIGAELLEQLPHLTTAYIPMGDTALIRGVATVLARAPNPIRVVGIVAEHAPAYYLSWKAGAVVETPSAETIADGLAVRRPLAPNVESIRRLVHDVVTVSEREMTDAIARLRSGEGVLAEPSGAAAVAALDRDRTRMGALVALVTGRNIAPEVV